MTKVRENVVSFTKPKGGTEILKQQLVQQLKEGDLKDINIVGSICHPDLIVKDKINIQKNVYPKIKNFSKIQEKMNKVKNNELKNSLKNFLKAFDERNK